MLRMLGVWSVKGSGDSKFEAQKVGRWVEGSLVYALLYSGLFPIPHLLSPLKRVSLRKGNAFHRMGDKDNKMSELS